MPAQPRKPSIHHRLTVGLPTDVYTRLIERAEANDVPAAQLIRRAVRELLNREGGTDLK